jgi:D-alanyl-D-alanine carboxypeptidase (penicillin-binding protein 5/6)
MIKGMMRKKRSTHRRLIIIGLVILLLAASTGYAFAKPLPAPALEKFNLTIPAAKTAPLAWPAYGQSAVGAAGFGVLATNGPQTPLATASIAKVMTALAVLKQKPLQPGQQGPYITLGQADVDSYNTYVAQGGSVVPVNMGEQISEYQALQALLLPSANNMADSLARWAFGSIDAYVAYANTYSKQLGLTTFHAGTDASGFSADTVASATDLAQLGLQVLKQPVLAIIANQPTATIPVAGQIRNVNALLGSHGIVGIKTGNNDADPGAFLFAANHTIGTHQLTIVGAVMGAPNLRSALLDAGKLIDSAGANFTAATVLPDHATMGYYHVPWQPQPIAIITTTKVNLVRWGDEPVRVTLKLGKLHVPASTNAVVGSLQLQSTQTKQAVSVRVVLANNIPKPSPMWRLEHAF